MRSIVATSRESFRHQTTEIVQSAPVELRFAFLYLQNRQWHRATATIVPWHPTVYQKSFNRSPGFYAALINEKAQIIRSMLRDCDARSPGVAIRIHQLRDSLSSAREHRIKYGYENWLP